MLKQINQTTAITNAEMTNLKGGKRTATVSCMQAATIMATSAGTARVLGTTKDGICIEW